MKNKNSLSIELNAGTGMVLGTIIGAAVALIVQIITSDSTIWSWAIPVGLASGLAIGAGRQNARTEEDA